MRDNHTAYCYPQTYRNCYSHTILNLSFPLNRPWCHTVGPLQTGLEVPKTLWDLRVWCYGLPFPLYSVMFLFFTPSETTQCLPPSTCPHSGLHPQSSHRLSRNILCKDAGLGSLLPPWCSRGIERPKKENGWKIVPVRCVKTKFSMAEARATDTANVLFLGQAPEVFTPGQILTSTCIAVNTHQITHWHSWEQVLTC